MKLKLKDFMFMPGHYRNAIARPRVHGGFAVMMDRVIINPHMDEIIVFFSRFPETPHKFNLSD